MRVSGFVTRPRIGRQTETIETNRPEDWESVWIYQSAYPNATVETVGGRKLTGTCARCRAVEYQGEPILVTRRGVKLCPDCR
jgi:hypothetical protein